MGNACGGSALREVSIRDQVVAESHSQPGHPRRTMSHSSSFSHRNLPPERKPSKKKYAYIPDNFHSLDQVTLALREAGLESSNLIVGIDFTKSNEWTGKTSFQNQSLHRIGNTPNPYEQAIAIVGRTLAPFDEDNLIPCFGFGDATSHDDSVFSFHSDHSPCHGFEEVLACYKEIVPNLKLSGPTSFAPMVEAAIDIVERSGGQYHVLVIIADGQVTRSIDTGITELSPQEEQTINSIVTASSYPMSIVLVGVGDGPWDDMRKFDDRIPAREFDNFQFVNFTAIMLREMSASDKEAAFALAALMEIPIQYKAAMEFGILGRRTGKAKRVAPRPPPVPATRRQQLSRNPTSQSQPQSTDDHNQACPICLTNAKDLAFGCGHMVKHLPMDGFYNSIRELLSKNCWTQRPENRAVLASNTSATMRPHCLGDIVCFSNPIFLHDYKRPLCGVKVKSHISIPKSSTSVFMIWDLCTTAFQSSSDPRPFSKRAPDPCLSTGAKVAVAGAGAGVGVGVGLGITVGCANKILKSPNSCAFRSAHSIVLELCPDNRPAHFGPGLGLLFYYSGLDLKFVSSNI